MKEYECRKCHKIIVTKLLWYGDPPEKGFCKCKRKEDKEWNQVTIKKRSK